MFIAIYDMKLEDTETQCIVWTKMNAIILKKGVANPNFKGMKQTMPKQIRMLSVLFMGLGILLWSWLTNIIFVFSIGLNH